MRLDGAVLELLAALHALVVKVDCIDLCGNVGLQLALTAQETAQGILSHNVQTSAYQPSHHQHMHTCDLARVASSW